MVEFNQREKAVRIKIVYYGPAVGGKTTNLQVLHRNALANRRGEMISINSRQDRTILFDLLPMTATGFRGFDVKIQFLAVPGQAMYATTRRVALKGVDAIVFVANSATDRFHENVQSFREMTSNLLAHQIDPTTVPMVLQYNKRDLPDVTPVESLDRALNQRNIPSIPAVAVRGEGVLETFLTVLIRTMQDLSGRYQMAEIARGQSIKQWCEDTVKAMFGTLALWQPPAPDQKEPQTPLPPRVAAPAPTKIQVALPDEPGRAGPRSSEALVEQYAEASSELGSALAEMRSERDSARERVEDFEHALGAAQDVLSGKALPEAVTPFVQRVALAARAEHGSFLMPDPSRGFRAIAFHGLVSDPLVQRGEAAAPPVQRVAQEREPRLWGASEDPELGGLLLAAEPAFGAALSVPIRTPRGLQGLVMIYYTPDAVLPKAETLGHVTLMARALSAPLESQAMLEKALIAEKAMKMALAGLASIRTQEEAVRSLVGLRDRLASLRSRPDAPPWFREESAMFTPMLAGPLQAARAMLAFSRGEVELEPILLEDVLADLQVLQLDLALGQGADTVRGDTALLRVALMALIEHARSTGTFDGEEPSVLVRSQAEEGRVRIDIRHNGPRDAVTNPSTTGNRLFEKSLAVPMARTIVELHRGVLRMQGGGHAILYLERG